MGMAFDSYITESELENKSDSLREKILIHSLVLNDEQAEKYADILEKTELSEVSSLDKEDYKDLCLTHQENASTSFWYDSSGFTSEIILDSDGLVFFSVPYNSGWSAEVNGKSVDVEKVSYGFMAVKAEKGNNTIVFHYRTPALTAGMIISISGIVIFAIYMIIIRHRKDKNDYYRLSNYYDYNSCHKITAHDDYCNQLIRKK